MVTATLYKVLTFKGSHDGTLYKSSYLYLLPLPAYVINTESTRIAHSDKTRSNLYRFDHTRLETVTVPAGHALVTGHAAYVGDAHLLSVLLIEMKQTSAVSRAW